MQTSVSHPHSNFSFILLDHKKYFVITLPAVHVPRIETKIDISYTSHPNFPFFLTDQKKYFVITYDSITSSDAISSDAVFVITCVGITQSDAVCIDDMFVITIFMK
jgi:hypothetical protein